MNDPNVSAAVERAIWEVATAVPGLVPVSIQGTDTWIVAKLHGWSPSLHLCSIMVTMTLPRGRSDPQETLEPLRAVAAVQAVRAADALAAGIGLPGSARGAHSPHLHLHADASLLGLLVLDALPKSPDADEDDAEKDDERTDERPVRPADPLAAVLKDAAGSLGLSHSGQRRYDGGPIISDSACVASDHDGVRAIGLKSASFEPGRATAPGTSGRTKVLVTTTAERVTQVRISDLPARLPNTVVAALPGRRLGDAVTMHPLLDPRVVATAHIQRDDLVVTLERLDAPLTTLVRPDAVDAIAELERIVATG